MIEEYLEPTILEAWDGSAIGILEPGQETCLMLSVGRQLFVNKLVL